MSEAVEEFGPCAASWSRLRLCSALSEGCAAQFISAFYWVVWYSIRPGVNKRVFINLGTMGSRARDCVSVRTLGSMLCWF